MSKGNCYEANFKELCLVNPMSYGEEWVLVHANSSGESSSRPFQGGLRCLNFATVGPCSEFMDKK